MDTMPKAIFGKSYEYRLFIESFKRAKFTKDDKQDILNDTRNLLDKYNSASILSHVVMMGIPFALMSDYPKAIERLQEIEKMVENKN